MKRVVKTLLLVILAAQLAPAGEVIDRVVATVNGRPILQSDWDQALRCEALLDGRSLQGTSLEELRSSLDRLVDQELLRQQAHANEMPRIPAEDVQKRVAEVRQQLGATTDQSWTNLLARYGLTAAEVERNLGHQLSVLRLIDERLRPSVHIDSASIAAYYHDKLEPELRRQGQPVAPIAEVSSKIEELLAQQRMDDLLTAWLKDLRQQAEVKVEVEPSTTVSAVAGSQ